MKHGTDLLNTLGKSPDTPIRHGQQVTKSNGNNGTAMSELPNPKEDDFITQAAPASNAVSNETHTQISVNDRGTSTNVVSESNTTQQVEPTGSTKPSVPGWTEDSLIAEMRKAREEAKRSRLEKNDAIERLKSEYERKMEELRAATKPLEDTARELENLKAKEADKKRTLEERLADREARLAFKEEESRKLEEKYERELLNIRADLESYKAEINVQNQFYQEKLNEELNSIPDKYKDYASRMTKGCDSARESLEIIREAKDRGLFKDKTTVVSHSVPDVENGVRLSSQSLKTQEENNKKKMKSTDKIGVALQNLSNNPIFRGGRK